MPLLLLLAFIGVPMLEIAVFIQVGGMIGLWATLGLVLLTAFVGTWQLRAQGLATLARGRAQLDAGELPTRELFDGMCLVLAGVLLLTPGFVTDFFGLLLFLPPFRDWLRGFFSRQMATTARPGSGSAARKCTPAPGPAPGPAPLPADAPEPMGSSTPTTRT